MKLAFIALALFAVGCSASAPDDVASKDDALQATDEDRVCFVVPGQPFNGNGEVWQLDGASLLHTQTFYWHGTPLRDFLGENPPPAEVYPLVENTDTRIVAGDAKAPITIDITAQTLGGNVYYSAVLHQPGHDDVVLPRVLSCR